MQKKVLALAVAGLVSGAAFAQSNVTVYGVVDTAYVNSTGGRAPGAGGQINYSGIDSGLMAGSRIGFKGEEGLGNGLKAIFTLEYYIAPDANNTVGQQPDPKAAGGSTSNTRQSFVGLQHAKYGTLSMGRQYAFGYGTQVRNDAFGGSAMGSLATLNGAGGNTFVAGSGARLSNSVVYASPNFSGFSGVVGYSFGEVDSTTTAASGNGVTSNGNGQGTNGVWTMGVNYANGPLNLDLGFQQRAHRASNINATAVSLAPTGLNANRYAIATGASGDSVNEWMIGGSYDFGVAKVFATYQNQSDNNTRVNIAPLGVASGTSDGSNRVWSLGASVPVFGNGKVLVSYSDLEWTTGQAGGSKSWSLGYTHALSKRTTLYTSYNYTDNDKDTLVAAGMVGYTRQIGESNQTFTAGISHAF